MTTSRNRSSDEKPEVFHEKANAAEHFFYDLFYRLRAFKADLPNWTKEEKQALANSWNESGNSPSAIYMIIEDLLSDVTEFGNWPEPEKTND